MDVDDDVVRWCPLCEYDAEAMPLPLLLLRTIIVIQERAIQLRWKYIFVAWSLVDMGRCLHCCCCCLDALIFEYVNEPLATEIKHSCTLGYQQHQPNYMRTTTSQE